MNTGIIMIGLALVLLSVGLISSPASAAVQGNDNCIAPCTSGIFPEATLTMGDDTGITSMTGTSCDVSTTTGSRVSGP